MLARGFFCISCLANRAWGFFTLAGGKGRGWKEKEMKQLDRGGKGKLSVRRVRYLTASSRLPCRVCWMGSEAGCFSKVEIHIHIRLHCGVPGRAVCCGVVWCGVVDDVVVFLFVRDTMRPRAHKPSGQVKVVRPIVQPIGTRETARPWLF